MSQLSKLITETFEKEQPELCAAIKMAVRANETRADFDKFIQKVCGPDYKTSITYTASLTAFDYYKQLKQRPL
jgi:hypothetical protein